jgi:hypothetical protein
VGEAIGIPSCGHILNTFRKNILEGEAAINQNKGTGRHRTYPCKSARLGINGLTHSIRDISMLKKSSGFVETGSLEL